MIKIYRDLTADQIKRGVIFSSTLSSNRNEKGETMHEVFTTDEDKNIQIKNLKNDSFFNNSPWKYNIIRQ